MTLGHGHQFPTPERLSKQATNKHTKKYMPEPSKNNQTSSLGADSSLSLF